MDSSDEDALTASLLSAASNLCVDVARLTDEQWEDIDSDKCCSKNYSRTKIIELRETMRVAILYALGYLYEHREEADYNGPPVKTKNKENIVNQYLPTLTLSVA